MSSPQKSVGVSWDPLAAALFPSKTRIGGHRAPFTLCISPLSLGGRLGINCVSVPLLTAAPSWQLPH